MDAHSRRNCVTLSEKCFREHTFLHSERNADVQVDRLHEWIKIGYEYNVDFEGFSSSGMEAACGCLNLSSQDMEDWIIVC
jgi:hypothetical protein